MHRLHQQSADDLARHEIAAGKVQRWIAAAKPADANHAYLQKKQLPAFGLTQAEANLIVPLSDETGKIWSAQTINQLGHKRFFTGGRKRGLFTPIGWRVGEPLTELIVGEGWATCAAAHLMFQIPAAAAMDCGNLLPAAKTIRKRHPATKLIFASDWDGHAGGIGTTTACEAAHAVGNARVIRPDCTDDAHCDFADNWLQNRGAI